MKNDKKRQNYASGKLAFFCCDDLLETIMLDFEYTNFNLNIAIEFWLFLKHPL